MNEVQKLCQIYKKDIIEFAQSLVRIKSITGNEKEVANAVKSKMQELGYDEILTSRLGDIIGIMGSAKMKILFDSHMDTVEVVDESAWSFSPFLATINDGKIYGRGTSDMKASIASSVYAGFFAKKLGFCKDKQVIISASVMEEDFDSYALGELIDEFKFDINYAVICEPSDQKIALGHRGRAMIIIDTFGISAHGSTPEFGKNAVYEMNKIIKRVEELNERFYQIKGEHGSVVLSRIECESASLNAVPPKATIYLDRRLCLGEDKNTIELELKELIKDTNATYRIDFAKGVSYTNEEFEMEIFFKAWESNQDSHLSKALGDAFREQMKQEPTYFKWPFATNGFATTKREIPTIGFGAGNIKSCHQLDEYCEVEEIVNASGIYANLIKNL